MKRVPGVWRERITFCRVPRHCTGERLMLPMDRIQPAMDPHSYQNHCCCDWKWFTRDCSPHTPQKLLNLMCPLEVGPQISDLTHLFTAGKIRASCPLCETCGFGAQVFPVASWLVWWPGFLRHDLFWLDISHNILIQKPFSISGKAPWAWQHTAGKPQHWVSSRGWGLALLVLDWNSLSVFFLTALWKRCNCIWWLTA